jgi:hypothetical protein
MYEDGSFKSINEKLFKMEIEANDDNREIAETTEDTEVSDDLMVLLQRFRNDILDKVQEFSDHHDTLKKTNRIGEISQKTEKISVFLNISDQLVNALKKADFNNFSKSVLQSITTLLNEIKEQYELLKDRIDLSAYFIQRLSSQKRDEQLAELPEDADYEQREEVIDRTRYETELDKKIYFEKLGVYVIQDKIEEIINLLEVKLINYQQNASNTPIDALNTPSDTSDTSSDTSLSGFGRARKNMFLDLGPYQNKQKLIV